MLLDVHSHVDRYDLVHARALESALAEIAQHEILTVSNSMDLVSYQRTQEIAARCDWVVPAFGVHPWNAADVADHVGDLAQAIESSPILGEIGLDHYFVQEACAYPAQRRVFEFLLGAAREQAKLVILHTKGAERDVLESLDRYDISRMIVHWYSGPIDVLRELVARGAYFSIGIEVLYSEHIRTLVQEIPFERLLTETDNPGGPKGFLGQFGMPLLVEDVVRGMAVARRTTTENMLQAVQANFLELVRQDPWLADIGNKVSKEP